jgi:hypothetical protein
MGVDEAWFPLSTSNTGSSYSIDVDAITGDVYETRTVYREDGTRTESRKRRLTEPDETN